MRLVWLTPLLAVGLAGCGAIGAIGIPLGGGAATDQPADFNALDPLAGPVETEQLPPLGGQPAPGGQVPIPVLDPLAAAGELGQPDQVAALAAIGEVTVVFDDLLGAWTMTIGGGSCQLFLSGTPWEDGFRGSTRDCLSEVLAAISSWRLDGQEVVVFAGGAAVARFYAVSLLRNGGLVVSGRFEGQMVVGGIPVAFLR